MVMSSSGLKTEFVSVALSLVLAAYVMNGDSSQAAPTILLWDTVAALPETPADTNGWKLVPRDLLALEANPSKARSDPGYYGREYSFSGDAVVENDKLAAVFFGSKGRVAIFSKQNSITTATGLQKFGQKMAEVAPLPGNGQDARIKRIQIQRHAGDQIVLEVFFSTGADEPCVFDFSRNEIVGIKSPLGMRGISIRAALEHLIVPSFIGDDLIYEATNYKAGARLHVPAENLMLGLTSGESGELVMTWPKGKQRLILDVGNDKDGNRFINSIEFENDGKPFALATLSAPGIWHKERLAQDYLEKDVALSWKKPFPAKWKTQLDEQGVKTTFAFRENKQEIWRGVPGGYEYPVWFEDDRALMRLGKKVPPQGDALIYFVEPQDTPATLLTPVEILRETIGQAASEAILDVAGRKLRTHHRRGGDGVRRACTCGCTEAIQIFFEKGEEAAKKEQIKAELEDMIYFVHNHVERIEEYRQFAKDLRIFFSQKATASPELKPYLDGLAQIAAQIEEEYKVQQENMKSFAYADELTQQTLKLCDNKEPKNLKAYMELLKAWRGMGGAQDYVLAQCHTITRKLCQVAGHTCTGGVEAATLAAEIRARCRQCLRHPDGYEIWADY
jgi:hypothetical protein